MKASIILTIYSILFITQLKLVGQDKSEKKLHPIEQRRAECHSIDSNWSTAGMIGCEADALNEWDDELNKVYKELMNLMDTEQKEMLKISQRKWIEFKDLESQFKDRVYKDMQGTMWNIARVSSRRIIIMNRTEQLQNLLTDLNAGK